jgi:hypothetical protein
VAVAVSPNTIVVLKTGERGQAGVFADRGVFGRDADGNVLVANDEKLIVAGFEVSAAADPQTRAFLAGQYGHLAAFIDHPEIGPLLRVAAEQGLDANRLQGALANTEWWRTKGAGEREWETLKLTDPASAKQKYDSVLDQVENLVARLGIELPQGAGLRIAENALRWGWGPQQLQQALVAEADFTGDSAGMRPGLAADTVSALKQIADGYLVPVSEATLDEWAQRVLAGDIDIKSFEGWAREQAKSLFPGMAAALDRGITVRQYVDPYVQLAARELELDPNTIDLSDPKWSRPLFQMGKDGERVQMSLADWQAEVRGNRQYGWHKTKAARAMSYDFASTLLETFGRIA